MSLLEHAVDLSVLSTKDDNLLTTSTEVSE